MKLINTTPRRLLQLDALFAGRGLREACEPVFEDARLPEDAAEVLALQRQDRVRLSRLAAEMALEEGGSRQYPPRREAVVLEMLRRR